MLRNSVEYLTNRGYQQTDFVLYNALLTSFPVYTRSLYLFFYATAPRPDDMVATDYFDDPNQWLQHRPAITSNLQLLFEAVGKRVAHLTYERVNGDFWWVWRDIYPDMAIVISTFLKYVPSNRLVPELLQLKL